MTTGAACLGADTNEFFADDQDRVHASRRRAVALAARYCHGCRIRSSCAAAAEARGDVGLWGGYWRYKDGSKDKATPLLDYLRDDDRTAA